MTQKIKVLFVDDDVTLGKIATIALQQSGYEAYYQTSLAAIRSVIKELTPDIIVLDVEIGKRNGIEVTPELKILAPNTPILFVSSHINSEEVVKALNAGGIAYLKKPFEIEELIAYINRHTTATSWDKIHLGTLTLAAQENLLLKGDTVLCHLTASESQLLKLLVAHKNQLVAREQIENELWNEEGHEHSLNNYISKLRKYLSADPNITLKTIFKVGYKLVD